MMIIGCDYHPSDQQIAFVDQDGWVGLNSARKIYTRALVIDEKQ
jgi:hypothetical protein